MLRSRVTRVVGVVLAFGAVLAVLLGRPGVVIGATNGSDVPLRSVLVRERDVFASSEAGLFRASKRDRQWHRLPLPKGMPAGGSFATEPPSANDLWYCMSSRAWPRAAAGKGAGLYHSGDGGLHWRLVSSAYDFSDVFLHPNGVLYAIIRVVTKEPEGTTSRDRIIMSRDQGKKWIDITGALGPGIQLVKIIADPEHPSLVALLANCMRAYILHAQDEHYRLWEMTREWDWMSEHMTDGMFLYREYSARAGGYTLPATLSNYFQYGFGSRTGLPAFDAVPGRSTCRFAASEPKRIPIAVRFLLPGPEPKLIDVKDQVGFWGLRVVDPKGKRTSVPAAVPAAWWASDQKPEDLERIRRIEGFGVHTLSAQHPYVRSIDLGQLYHFDQKGTYRVQLLYDGLIADPARGEWPGSFAGSVFEVVIR